jgi:hypothetical protein
MRWSPNVHLPVLVVLAVACLALFPALFLNRIPAQTDLIAQYSPWLFGADARKTISGGDSFFVYLPDRLAAVREWKTGHLPLWNPYLGGGMPMLGMQTADPLDPLIVLHFIFSLGRAMGIAYATLLFMAGFGMVLFLRSRGVRHPAALAGAGVAFALNPYFLSWLELRVFLAGLATLPLALWALDALLLDQGKPKHSGILALSLGYAILAGTLQTLAIFLAIVVLRLGWNFLTGTRASRTMGLTGMGLMLGLAIGTLSLVPSFELLNHSVRLQSDRGYYANSNFLPWRAVALWFNHDLFGKVGTPDSRFWNVLHRTTNSSSGWGALGILPLFLAVFALIRRAGPRTERIFWGGLSGLILAFLFLMQTGFAGIVKSLWPEVNGTDLLRGLFLVNLSGSVLAGWGMQELIQIWTARNGTRTWALPFGAFVILGTFAVLVAIPHGGFHYSLFRALLPLLVIGPAVAVIGMMRMSGTAKGWLLVALIALDLGRIHFKTNPFCDPSTAYPSSKAVDSIKSTFGPPDYPRFFVFSHIRAFPPNIGSVFELSDLRTYSNMPIAGFRAFLEWAEGAPMINQEYLLHPDSPIYRMLGARYLFSTAIPTQSSYVTVPLPDLPVSLYRRPDALPRAFLVHDVARVPDRGSLRTALQDPQFDPAQRVYLVGDVDDSIARAKPRGPDQVDIKKHTSTRVVIDVMTDAPGIVVLSDAFYPGWRAKRNRQDVPILPAYGGLRGVSVPAGSSEIIMNYRPEWLWPGLFVTVLAGITAIWLAVAGRFSASRAPASS